MPKNILTDTKYLRQIKKLQLRQQLPSLALLALSFLVSFAVPLFGFHYPSLIMSILALTWYMYIGICFRFKQRISIPDGDLLLSPVTGRVRYLKTASGISLLKIAKSRLDTVEIRSPHASSVWEYDNIRVNYHSNSLIFRLEANNLIRLEDASMEAGSVIGFMIGDGSCSISLPEPLHTDLHAKSLCEAGLSVILES